MNSALLGAVAGPPVARAAALGAVLALSVLAILYRWPGDSTLEGEILTIWPPELWAATFVGVASLVALTGRRRGAAVLVAVFVFLCVTSEWIRSSAEGRPIQRRERTDVSSSGS